MTHRCQEGLGALRKGLRFPWEQDTGRCHWAQLVSVGQRDALSTGADAGPPERTPES